MDKQTYLHLLRASQEGDTGTLFSLTNELYDVDTALQALILTCSSDEQIYSTVRKAMNDRRETENLLLRIWSSEKIKAAKPEKHSFFVFFSERGDMRYRIGITINIDDGHPDVWYHHVSKPTRHLHPEACVDWTSLSPEEEAMWTLLVSKIEQLPTSYYIEAAQACNDFLLVPYEDLPPADMD